VEDQPETDKPKPTPPRSRFVIGGIGLVVLVGLIYGLFNALPNPDAATDFARFKTNEFKGLEVLRAPPPQPVATFANAAGQPTTLAAFQGRVTLVNLWATWCAPCVTEMPTLARLQGLYSKDDLAVVAISVDRDDTRLEAIDQLKALTNGTLDFYHDPKMGVVFPMKARGFPTTVLYDRNGKELARYAGEADWAGPAARSLIEAAIADK
jgi:thiol-disulfide isomerase/thioredoxin